MCVLPCVVEWQVTVGTGAQAMCFVVACQSTSRQHAMHTSHSTSNAATTQNTAMKSWLKVSRSFAKHAKHSPKKKVSNSPKLVFIYLTQHHLECLLAQIQAGYSIWACCFNSDYFAALQQLLKAWLSWLASSCTITLISPFHQNLCP